MEGSRTVLLIGTLDTKGHEYAYLRDRLLADGVDVLVVDVGINDTEGISPDVTRHEVAASVGADADALSTASGSGPGCGHDDRGRRRVRPNVVSRRDVSTESWLQAAQGESPSRPVPCRHCLLASPN